MSHNIRNKHAIIFFESKCEQLLSDKTIKVDLIAFLRSSVIDDNKNTAHLVEKSKHIIGDLMVYVLDN